MSAPRPPADLRPLLRLLSQAGWVVVRTSGGHAIWRSPRGGTLAVPVHVGAYRGFPPRLRSVRRNVKAAVRRLQEET